MNPFIRYIRAMLVASVSLLILTGCGASKSVSEAGRRPVATATAVQRADSLAASYGDWSTVSMPVRLSISEPRQFSVNARCTMRRGDFISMSVRMLGFEVASLWLDNDSIHAVDKYHKRYLSEGLRRFLGGADVTIADLQDLLLGRAFVAGANGGTLTPALLPRMRIDPMDEGVMLLPVNEPAEFNYGFVLSDTDNHLAAATVLAGEKHAVVVNYDDFRKTPAGETAQRTAIETVRGRRLAAAFGWNLKSAKWNDGTDQRWTPPSGYARVSSGQLMEMLSKF